MLNISTLSPDIRLLIVHLNIDMAVDKKLESRNLSLVCRSMNDTCGSIIFRKYHLILRSKRWLEKVYPPAPFTFMWDEAAIRLRLAHLRSKAPYVRELTITDMGKSSMAGSTEPEAFPAKFMPELITTLSMLSGLTSFSLVASVSGPTIFLHTDLWMSLVQISPAEIHLAGKLGVRPGQDLVPTENLDKLSVLPYGIHFTPIIDVLRPSLLEVRYTPRVEMLVASRDLIPFKPTDPRLETIVVRINALHVTFDMPVLDFSAVPSATIYVNIYFVTHRMNIPAAWKATKAKLQQVFTEDLSGFDVSRRSNSTTVLVFRSPRRGWRPTSHDHVGGEDKDRQEEADMKLSYYRYKYNQTSGWP